MAINTSKTTNRLCVYISDNQQKVVNHRIPDLDNYQYVGFQAGNIDLYQLNVDFWRLNSRI